LLRRKAKDLLHKMDSDRLSRAVIALVELVRRLRGPGGCPWDAKQTDSSIKMYLIEEAYEVLDAIEKKSPHEVCQELGDLLFQIVFLARLAEERKEYGFEDVIEMINEKMIRRHPHVFGDVRVESAEEVAVNWAKIKQGEKTGDSEKGLSSLHGVPGGLPSLLRAHRLGERASKAGLDWRSPEEIQAALKETWLELEKASGEENAEKIGKEIGTLLFHLVQLARHRGLNAENLLRGVNQDFLHRFAAMERELKASKIEPEEATVDQMNEAWKKAKDKIE
jgi:tetrapyrrole methylase family protein / MazG family protein